MINNCIKNQIINLIKYGKIKSYYYRLKKNKKKIFKYLIKYFKKNVIIYLIKLKIRKGDGSLIGELGIYFSYVHNLLK